MKNKIISLLLLILFAAANIFAADVSRISASLLKKASETESFAARTMSAEDGKIDVLFYPVNGRSSNIDETYFKSRGIEYIKSRNYLSAKVPVSMIWDLENVPGVQYIDFDFMPKETETVSQGRDLINASEYVLKGVSGAGISIAIIDLGFSGYRSLQTAGELPKNLTAKSFTYDGDFEYTEHGSACAEIVYDIAPGAKMYLLQVGGIATLQNAFDYCKENGIKVVSGSFGWVMDFFCDGTGKAAKAADEAFGKGILPVFAAGNQAQLSWFGKFDGNGGEWMIFPGGKDYLDVYAFSSGEVWMMWDDFTAKNKKYTLYMYDTLGTLIDSSSWNEGNNPNVYVSNKSVSKAVMLKIKKENAYDDVNIRLYFDGVNYRYLSDIRSESSLCTPGDSRKVVTVGAVSSGKWDNGPIEDYSSRGPTQKTAQLAEAVKPDLVAPSRVNTVTYGANAFSGTSASVPHVAASAVLLLSLDRTMSAAQLRSKVIGYAAQIASSADNTYGYGKLVLGTELSPDGTTGDIVCYPNPASISRNGHVKITNLPYNTALIDINVFTVTGEFVKSFNAGDMRSLNGRMTIEWNLKNQNGDRIAPGVYFFVIDTPLTGKKIKKIAVKK